MNDKNESKKMNPNESKNESKNETKKMKKSIIGTSELSDLISEKIGRTVEPKRIRSIFRNDSFFNQFDDSKYTKYQFEYPSETVDIIIERFIEIESERNERIEKTKKRKTERKNKSLTVLSIDKTGTVESKSVNDKTDNLK